MWLNAWKGHVRLRLAHAGVRGCAWQYRREAIGGVGNEGLVDRQSDGVEEAHQASSSPGEPILGVADVNVVNDLQSSSPRTGPAGLLGPVLGMADHVLLVGAEEHERTGDQCVALAEW